MIPVSSPQPAPGLPRRDRSRLLFLIALGLGSVLYLLLGPISEGGLSTTTPNGYYGLMTDALLSGQAHLKVQPDPALKLLENPWAGNQGIPRLHDAVYFHDRYYLYFSPLPALVVCIPWKLVTGTFLSDGAATAVCALVALVLGCLFLLRCWRRWFAELPVLWLAAGLAAICLGNGLIWLVTTYSVYPVPISAAAACSMAGYLLLARALDSIQPAARTLALGLSSLTWGLVVACRPNHALCLPALGLAAFYLVYRTACEHGWQSRATGRLAAAALLPAAAVGAVLAVYNQVRFGSFTEFGTSYMFIAGDPKLVKVFSLQSLGENLFTYLLQPLDYSPYFPFVELREAGVGLLLGAPLGFLLVAWPLTLLHRPLRNSPTWIFLGLALLIDCGMSLLSISLLPTANERYRADFLPAAIMLGTLTTYGLLDWMRGRSFLRRAMSFMLAVIMGWTLLHAGLLAMAHNPRPEKTRSLARAANRLTAFVEHARGVEFGPVSGKVHFRPGHAGTKEPLVVSGFGRDVLYVWYSGEKEIRLGFFHVGAGGPVSDPIPVDFDHEYELRLDLGCFYPPADHPAFSGWTEPKIRLRRRQLVVSLDGQPVLNTGSDYYPSRPGDIQFGHNPGPYAAPGRFSGTLADLRHLGLTAAAAPASSAAGGPLRLTVRFPPFVNFKTEPLVSTGHAPAGDLIYVSYVAEGKLRFGHDTWGGGGIETQVVNYVPNEPQIVELDLPSLYFSPDRPNPGRFILRYNGTILLADDRPYHLSDPAELVTGFNGCDSSAARMNFTGKFDRVERIAPLALPENGFQVLSGPVRLVLKFPPAATGRSEPLLVTGRNGAADVVYVQYVDGTHVRFGYDHWSKGGPVTHPIAVDFAATHVVEIQMDSLYPPGSAAASSAVVVQLDNRTVLRHREKAYPSEPAEITAGLNSIGASSCDRLFTGRIFEQERLGLRQIADK